MATEGRVDGGRGFRLPNIFLVLPAVVCFLQAARMPWTGDLNSVQFDVLGGLLLAKALFGGPEPIPAVVAGYILCGVVVAAARGVLPDNLAITAVVIVSGVCFFWWRKVERLWKRDE